MERLEVEIRAKVEKFKGDIEKAVNESKRNIEIKFAGRGGLSIPESSEQMGGLGEKISSGLSSISSLGSMFGIGIGAGAVIGALKSISANIEDMHKTLKESSPAFKGMEDAFDRIEGMILRPMGDMMMLVMKPYYQLALMRLREGMQEISAIREEYTEEGVLSSEGVKKINEAVMSMMTQFTDISYQMNSAIDPMQSSIAGFQQGLELMRNNWLTNAGIWIQEFFKGLGSGSLSDETAEWFLENLETGKTSWEELPENIRGQLVVWIQTSKYKDDIESWPKPIKEEYEKLVEKAATNDTTVSELLTNAGIKIDTLLMDPTGASNLSQVGTNFAVWIMEELKSADVAGAITSGISGAISGVGTGIGNAINSIFGGSQTDMTVVDRMKSTGDLTI